MVDDYRHLTAYDYAYSGNMHEYINDGIARIESIKLKILGNMMMSEFDRSHLIEELNNIRSAYLHMSTLAARPEIPMDSNLDTAPTVASDLELEGILGDNPRILENLDRISRLAASRLTILLEGETGCGKEMFARIIHLNSKRTKFVAVNCGALPSNLIESELFGHVRGAFTGAVTDRKGRFEEADGGTIFLDEIGEMEPLAQVKLLRALDSGEIQRVGSDRTNRVDVRVVAATNRNLEKMVAEGTFREDLFFRLNICHLTIPPLRERRDEIPPLLDYFMNQTCAAAGLPMPALDDTLLSFLRDTYGFPGNIRELRNIALYISHIYRGHPVTLDLLPERYLRSFSQRPGTTDTVDVMDTVNAVDDAAPGTSPQTAAAARQAVLDKAERNHLIGLLTRHKGNVPAICQVMGLSRGRLYQLFKKHDLMPGAFRTGRVQHPADRHAPSA